VALVGIEGATVRVSLQGACRHCAMASSTLTDFVAERIKLYVPEITDVVAE
jgi:Fe-S cluster biogenesis protein NfuA